MYDALTGVGNRARLQSLLSGSKLVKDISVASGHKLFLTKVFHPILLTLGQRIGVVKKVFGNEVYDMYLSNHFDGKYRVVSYEESIKRMAKKRE